MRINPQRPMLPQQHYRAWSETSAFSRNFRGRSLLHMHGSTTIRWSRQALFLVWFEDGNEGLATAHGSRVAPKTVDQFAEVSCW